MRCFSFRLSGPGRTAWLLLLPALLLGLAQARAAESLKTLSANDALALFYQRNLDLIAARYNLEQSKAKEIIAHAVPNPTISVDLLELDASRNLANNGVGPGVAINVSQLIETAGKRRLRIESSALGTQASESDLANAMRTLSAAVRHAYYALLLAQRTTEVASEAVARYAKLVELHELRLKKGDIPASDLWRMKVEALKAQADLINARAAQHKARVDLATLLRWPDDALKFQASDDWPKPQGFDQGSVGLVIDQALEQRPDMRSARLQSAQAQKDLHLAHKMIVPDITLNAGYAHEPNNMNLETGNIGLSAQVPLFYRNQGEIRKAEIDADTAELQIQQLEQSIRSEVTVNYQAYQSANTIADDFARDALEQVKAIRDSAEIAYQKGQTSILDLIDAQRDYREVMLQYQNVLYNRTVAYVDLKAASGKEEKP